MQTHHPLANPYACLLLIAAALLACALSFDGHAATPPAKPNVVVILTDDQGYGDVAYAGRAADLRTPNIDNLAAQGMRFNNFYSNSSVCSPTRAALMTGRYPALVGVPGTVARDPDTNMGYFSPTGPTLPELLKTAGYATGMVGKWHLGDYLGENPRNLPTRRGFDFFHGFIGAAGDYYTHDGSNYGWPGNNLMMLNETVINPASLQGMHTTDLVTQWAKEYIQTRAGTAQPFLLYLAYSAPHDPIQPPQAYLDRVLARQPGITAERAKIVALIEHLDNGIGQVIQTLKDTGKYNNTLIVFNSDNGGYLKHAANNGPYRGGKLDFYEGGIRVPMVAAWPGVIAPGTSNQQVALTMDLYPTIAEAAGAAFTHPVEGRSILPNLLNPTLQNPARNLIFENRSTIDPTRWKTHYAVRSEDWKLVQNAPGGVFELYNLANDPYETLNLAGSNTTKVNQLKALLATYQEQERLVPWQPPLAFEHGVISSVSGSWRTINLSRRYRAPVVLTSPLYPTASTPPVVTRVRDVNDLTADHDSFDLRLARADGLTAALAPLDVYYTVIEAGVYNETHHGATLEALRFRSTRTDNNSSWVGTSRPYANAYTQPVVLGQVLSENDARFTAFWSRGASALEPPSSSKLYVGRHVGEDPVRTRSAETLGYVVAESGLRTINGQTMLAGLSPALLQGIDDTPPYNITLSGLSQASTAVISQTGMKDPNGSWAVLYGSNAVASNRLRATVVEDRLLDSERSHLTTERAGYLVFGPGLAPPAVAMPTIAPAAGTYSDAVTVTLATTTTAATVYYTLDGSDPASSAIAIPYGGAFTLTGSATVRAVGKRDGYTNSTVASATYTVTPVGATGALGGSAAVAPSTVSLSSEGTMDWVHWGRVNTTTPDRKAGVTPRISDYAPLGGANPSITTNIKSACGWSDGTPTASVTGTKTGLWVFAAGKGFQFTVPADTAARTLKVYVGLNAASGLLETSLSDGSAPAYSLLLDQPSGRSSRVVTLNYRAASAGQQLTVRFTVNTLYLTNFASWVTLESAALQ